LTLYALLSSNIPLNIINQEENFNWQLTMRELVRDNKYSKVHNVFDYIQQGLLPQTYQHGYTHGISDIHALEQIYSYCYSFVSKSIFKKQFRVASIGTDYNIIFISPRLTHTFLAFLLPTKGRIGTNASHSTVQSYTHNFAQWFRPFPDKTRFFKSRARSSGFKRRAYL